MKWIIAIITGLCIGTLIACDDSKSGLSLPAKVASNSEFNLIRMVDTKYNIVCYYTTYYNMSCIHIPDEDVVPNEEAGYQK